MRRHVLAALILVGALSVNVLAQTTAIRAGRLIDPENGTIARDQIILIDGLQSMRRRACLCNPLACRRG